MKMGKKIPRRISLAILAITIASQQVIAQRDLNFSSALYNCLIGGLTGGLGGTLNRAKAQNPYKAFARGFLTGAAGGVVIYSGKKLNFLVSQKQEPAYAWLSRMVYSAGNSVVENAASCRPFWSRWHMDLSFVRVEYDVTRHTVRPRVMLSSFVSTVFMSLHGRPDLRLSLRSGTMVFRTHEISYAPRLIGSTAGNGFILNDTVNNSLLFHDVFAHEMNHVYQFQDFSGANYFFNKPMERLKSRVPALRQIQNWIYGDLNYELMLFNYFIVNGGVSRGNYCHNFLENEAEFLSVGRPACW